MLSGATSAPKGKIYKSFLTFSVFKGLIKKRDKWEQCISIPDWTTNENRTRDVMKEQKFHRAFRIAAKGQTNRQANNRKRNLDQSVF